MSLSDILGSALSGLNAAQAGLRTVSNNVANVGTAGYARQQVIQSTAVTSGDVTGVIVGEPSRVADQFLEGNVYRRASDAGSAEVTASYLDQLQGLLGAAGADSGLSSRLDAVSASAIAMTGSLSSPQTVQAFTSSVQDAISSMQQLDSDVSTLRTDVQSQVGNTVDTINGLLKNIHDLNATVASLTGRGRSAAGAQDQRSAALEQLSGLMKVTIRDQSDGRVTIDTAAGVTLLDRRLRLLSNPSPGQSVAQPDYPPIEIRFADSNGDPAALTGDSIEPAAGGKLGGLLDLRDRTLPAFSDQLGVVFGGLAQSLNAVSNAGSSVPAPVSLQGRQTALVGSDRAGFAGAATFAVVKTDGTLVASTRIDFSALPPSATIDDAVTAINAGLGGKGLVTFSGGKLAFVANGTGTGVAVAQDAVAPSTRGGVGFAQYFGLNDLIRSDTSPLVQSGFAASDPTGFGTGETVNIVLRDSTGRALARHTLTGSLGPTFGDLTSELNASPLGGFGNFVLNANGRIEFRANSGVSGAALSIPSDSTDRYGTGQSFSRIAGLTGASSGLAEARVAPTMASNPAALPLARLNAGALVGSKALGVGDTSGAAAFVDQLSASVDFGLSGMVSVQHITRSLLAGAATQSTQAQDRLVAASAQHDDAVNRRNSFSGVNIDEELSQMVVLQNSYSAAARMISTASAMYDTLMAMVP